MEDTEFTTIPVIKRTKTLFDTIKFEMRKNSAKALTCDDVLNDLILTHRKINGNGVIK